MVAGVVTRGTQQPHLCTCHFGRCGAVAYRCGIIMKYLCCCEGGRGFTGKHQRTPLPLSETAGRAEELMLVDATRANHVKPDGRKITVPRANASPQFEQQPEHLLPAYYTGLQPYGPCSTRMDSLEEAAGPCSQ